MFKLFKKEVKRVYLDNAGATKVSAIAKRAFIDALDLFGNPSAIHQEGDRASHALQKARNSVATTLNAHSYEVIFVGTGTESCNLAIIGAINAAHGIEKPHIITTAIEHPAVLEPIKQLEKSGRVSVTYLPV
jgi:cysteine desulfurase